MRRVLGQDTIIFNGERYMFNRNLDYVYDVEVFVDCLSRAAKAPDIQERNSAYQEAIQVYNGIYLPEINGTWASVEREHLQQAYVDIRLKLADSSLEEGEFHSAITICNNLILEDPVLEEAHRVAMRAYAAMGNRAAIIQQYNMLKNKLLAEMGITPSTQTETLYQKLVH
jgi:DNA-binding SARP family transcriptional activator